MGTRAVIAKPTKTGFSGRYHHWDGYPEGLGAELFQAFNGHFKQDLAAMLKTLLKDHPAGWSTICGADWAKPCGYGSAGPQCYCHGERSEGEIKMNHRNASGSGCEWAYVFSIQHSEPVMEIYSAYHRDGNKAIGYFGCGDEKAVWHRVATIQLRSTEPNWEEITEAGVEPKRPIVNFV